MIKDFAIFILSHGRADNVKTLDLLKKLNYDGKWYIIVDTTDSQISKYKKNFGDNKIIIFDKEEEKNKNNFDMLDNFNISKGSVVNARNVNFDIAKRLGIKYFLQLDDDYNELRIRFTKDYKYCTKFNIKNELELIINKMIEFMKINKQIKSFAMAQSGDFMGGENGTMGSKIFFKRKVMNTFLFFTDRPIKFIGRINEDVNLYIKNGSIGDLFFTTNLLAINQVDTQISKGGLTDIYLNLGTYVKSFYTFLINPSCIKIVTMGVTERRIHHQITWKYAVPKILNESCKKD